MQLDAFLQPTAAPIEFAIYLFVGVLFLRWQLRYP